MPNALQPYLEKVGGPRRAMIILVGVVAALAIFGVSQWATRPEWVSAFSGVPLESVSTITEKLDGAGIRYRLERGGTDIQVASVDIARARVAIAKDGGLPNAGDPGMEIFDRPSWGMTDFTQRINYRRALEGELERTIGSMRGVQAAKVHLALKESASFRRTDDRPSHASVVLTLRGSTEPAADVVKGIQSLVAGSVDGIDAENVRVLDAAGRLVSDENNPNSLAGLTAQQFATQTAVENNLERKAQDVLAQVVGAENATVKVAAALNFDRVERTTQSVDPERQAITTEQKYEITPGAEGGAASSNTATAYENTTSTETFAASPGSVKRLTVAVVVRDAVTPATSDTAKPVVRARTADEIARLEALVRGAVGADTARGDVVSVVSVPPVPVLAEPADEAPSLVETLQEAQRPVLSIVSLLLVFALAFFAMKSLKPAAALAQPQLALAGAGGAGIHATATALGAGDGVSYVPNAYAAEAALPPAARSALPAASQEPAVEFIAPPAERLRVEAVSFKQDDPTRLRVAHAVDQKPETAARLVRSWLKEG